MKKPIRVLLVDDHLVVRMGLAAILGLERDLRVVGAASTGLEAVAQAEKLAPDVVVMDMMMPGEVDGAEATRRIVALPGKKSRVLILTTFSASERISEALHVGASGALVKDSSQRTILDAIRRVAAGETVVSDEIAVNLSRKGDAVELSGRQLEILKLVACGFTNPEIAEHLHVGLDCVKAHLKLVFARLGVSNRAEAVSYAFETGILDRGENASSRALRTGR